jgi:predicted RNA polymerase sigma factor
VIVDPGVEDLLRRLTPQVLGALDGDERMSRHHRLPAVRAHLLEMAGDPAGARSEYLRAARRATSLPEKRYLEARAAAPPAPP